MIVGNLSCLSQAGLPKVLHDILAQPSCSLTSLTSRADGRFQPEGSPWFCHISAAQTQPESLRHIEYHREWADIQVILSGCEWIKAGPQACAQPDDEERKPDLFITASHSLPVAMRLTPGDFAVFLPGEPHQALCADAQPETVRKAVFKVPRSLLEV